MAGILEMILKKVFALVMLVAISACSKKPDCMVADSIQEIGNESLNNKGLHLYLRTSGFSEKEHFYELFRGVPSFDECGITTTDTLYQVHVDTSLGTPEKLIIKNNKIEIEYKSGEGGNQLGNVIVILD